MSYPVPNEAGINESSQPMAGADRSFAAASFYPVSFGKPHVPGAVPQTFTAGGLVNAVQFGVFGALFGMPGGAAVYPAASLSPTHIGTPSMRGVLVAGPTQGLTPARFGQAVMRVSLSAQGLAPARFGTPTVAVDAQSASLRPVRFGVPSVRVGMHPQSLTSMHFGRAMVRHGTVVLEASSLTPVHFGTPMFKGVALRARSMRPVRFGAVTIDRGAAC